MQEILYNQQCILFHAFNTNLKLYNVCFVCYMLFSVCFAGQNIMEKIKDVRVCLSVCIYKHEVFVHRC